MRIAYLDCSSGISGDMFLGALVDAGVSSDAIAAKIGSLALPNAHLEFESVKRCGFRGTKVHVHHEPESKHRHLRDIVAILAASSLTDRERTLAVSVFERLAEAEAQVHGTTVDRVHFHEVGAVDSIVDIVGSCVGWLQLGIDRALASAIPVGGGFVEIAHGRCPVPAPATAELLRGIPLAVSPCDAELTTPTGAALLSRLVDDYGPLPPIRISAIGYGAGTHDFTSHANLLRLMIGDDTSIASSDRLESDEILCLETHVDDTTGEMVAHCMEQLFQAGAVDAFMTPIVMKKGRPGVQITVLGRPSDQRLLEEILFAQTSTIGIRHWTSHRSKLPRESITVDTTYGSVVGKRIRLPDGSSRFAPEYESCRQRAQEFRVALDAVMRAAQDGYAATTRS